MIVIDKTRNILLFSCSILSIFISAPSQAKAIIQFEQQGGNVVATGSGSINLAGLFASFSGYDGFTAVSGHNAYGVLGPTAQAFDSVTFYIGATGPASFGTSSYVFASTGSGDRFGIDAANYSGPGSARIWISPSYVSGTALSATDSWTGATLASLGLTPGVYTYGWGTGANADTLQVRIGAVATGGVPEPASWALMLLGFGATGAMVRRRKTRVLAEC